MDFFKGKSNFGECYEMECLKSKYCTIYYNKNNTSKIYTNGSD